MLSIMRIQLTLNLLKVNNRNTRKRCEKCTKLTIKTLFKNKKKTRAFTCTIYETFKNTYFEEQLRTTACHATVVIYQKQPLEVFCENKCS